MKATPGTAPFLLRVTIFHAVSYFLVGIVAASAFDYESLFEQPVIRDYMYPFGSIAVYIGPVVQVIRGLILGLVLLPFREPLATRYGWLWLWLLLVGIGILSTSAAAPSSIEGIVYSRIPLWYHAIGLPEMLVQTLIFSVLTALYLRHPRGALGVMPPLVRRIVRALVTAFTAFAGYAGASVLFALGAGAGIDTEQNLTLEVQGLFIAPLLANGVIAYLTSQGVSSRGRLLAAVASYVTGFASILMYQAIVSGAPGIAFALLAPVLPAVIVGLLAPRVRIPQGGNADVVEAPMQR